MSTPVVTVLGLGEAGGRFAADLVSAGVDVSGYDPLSVSTPPGVARVDDPLSAVSGATIVLALTTAETALAAAESALPGLRADAIYADLNTASPALKGEIGALVATTGARFADVALLGPVPVRGLATPAVASGPGAQAFAEAFRPLGMPVDVVSDRPGDAATLKLLRSVFMKGLAASLLESLRAAEAAGHREWLEGEIAAVIGEPLLERLVEGSRRHALRRVDEMHAARELLLELGVEPRVVAASAAVLEELAATTSPDGTGCASMTSPSDRARALVRGAYDLHVHVAPDVPPRRIDDRELAQRCAELGLAGFALKSHYTSTAERAQVVSALFPEVEVVGHAHAELGRGRHERARRRDRRP